MKIWIDAQLSPAIAAWINRNYENIQAHVRSIGLHDASDIEIFEKARDLEVVIMSKDYDFIELVDKNGPPPRIIWITCGNTSNEKMRKIFSKTLLKTKELLEKGEVVVEISDKRF